MADNNDKLINLGLLAHYDEKIKEYIEDQQAVTSVNSKTGAVTLTASDVDALPDDIAITKGTGTSAVKLNSSSEASGDYALAEGYLTKATNTSAHAEGYGSIASGGSTEPDYDEHLGDDEPDDSKEGYYTHAEGNGCWAKGQGAHAEGYRTKATSQYTHSEGYLTSTNGRYSHAEGRHTHITTGGMAAHAEGRKTTASNTAAHAEGYGSLAKGRYSHAQNFKTEAVADYSHAEGYKCIASDKGAHAEGLTTEASGTYSHTGGIGTKAKESAQTAIGKYNTDNANALLIVGRGLSDTERANAFEAGYDSTNGDFIKIGTEILTQSELTTMKNSDNVTQDWVEKNTLSGGVDENGYFETDQYDEICFDANSLTMLNGDTIATEEWVTNTAKAKSAGTADSATYATTAGSAPASDVYSWAKATSKPSYTKSEVGLGNVDNVKQYSSSNPPPYPVTSVNSKTGAVTITAADLGLSGAMKFLGTSSTAISDGSTTKTITVSGSSITVSAGNVVLYGGYEYVWTGSAWEQLGQEGSFKTKQSAVTSPTASGSTTAFIDTISQDANGKITATKKNVSFPVTSVNSKTGVITLTKGDIGLGNVNNTADSSKTVAAAYALMDATDEEGEAKIQIGFSDNSLTVGDIDYIAAYSYSEDDDEVLIKDVEKNTLKTWLGVNNVDNVKQYSSSNPPPYPVTSVNGQTGAVQITIPTKTSDLTNDSGYATKTQLASYIENAGDDSDKKIEADGSLYLVSPDVSVVGTLYVAVDPADDETDWIDVKEEFSKKVDKVSGKGLSTNDYTTTEKNKLAGIEAGANKTTVDSALSSTSTNPVQNKVINSALAGKANSSHTHTKSQITDFPSIPTVNNATLTIQKNGTNVATFTANSSTNATANITVPTGAAANKGVDTSISAGSTSTNLPTSQAVASFVEGKGYTTNTGDITAVVAGNGLTGGATSGSATLNVGAGTGITVNADTIEVKYGTTAGTACQGNDSRLSDARTPTSHKHTKSEITDFPTSMPASDVYSWAKAASKPSYTADDVGAIAIDGGNVLGDITFTLEEDCYFKYNGSEVATHDWVTNQGFKKTDNNTTYTLSKSGSKIILTDSNGNTSSVTDSNSYYDDTDIVSRIETLESDVELIKEQIACFRGDTQILMADGSTKDIKDVKYGDMIKSYDIENNCLIDVKSYGAYATGFEQFWNVTSFTNGSVLYIARDGHYLYHPVTQKLVMSKNFPIRGKAYSSNGDKPYLVGRKRCNGYDVEKRYELISENGLFFANDILAGHAATSTFHHYKKGHLPLTEEEAATVEEDIRVYIESDMGGLDNPDFLKECGKLLMVVNKRKEKIEEYKNRLAEMDYKQVKWAQGKLSELDYKKYLSECETYRACINESEAKLAEERNKLKEARERFGINKINKKEQFFTTYRNQMRRIKERQNNK